MSKFKYDTQALLREQRAPLTAAVGLALSAGSLQAATITVTSLADGSVPGQCTLRDAFSAANTDSAVSGCGAGSGADVIDMTALSGTITLSSGYLLADPGGLTINGPGPEDLIIDGDGTNAIFAADGSSLSIDGLRMTNGRSTSLFGGAAVLALDGSTISLQNCQIDNNTAAASAYGGAVTIVESTAIVDGCEFTENVNPISLRGSIGNNAYGGAVMGFQAALTITQSYFAFNQSFNSGGAIALSESTLDIDNSNFDFNSAAYGGAIAVANYSTLNMYDVVLSDNEASVSGGAVIAGSDSVVNIEDSNINANVSTIGGGIQLGSLPSIILADDSAIESSTISTHRGDPSPPPFSLAGPASATISYSSISGNQAYSRGGGLSATASSTANITYGYFENNQAAALLLRSAPAVTERSRGGVNAENYSGGGLFVTNSAEVRLDQSVIASNVSDGLGGGAMADRNGTIYLESSVVEQNQAVLGGGLFVGVNNSNSIPLRHPERGIFFEPGQINLYNSQLSNNQAFNGAGLSSDGGIFGTKYSDIANNVAEYEGGGIFSQYGELAIYASSVIGNSAEVGAGLAAIGSECDVNIRQSRIANNIASGDFGGAAILECSGVIKYSEISNNEAELAAGLFATGRPAPADPFNIFNTTITENSGQSFSGFLATDVNINAVTVSHNTVTGPKTVGAAIDLQEGGATVRNSIFSDTTGGPDFGFIGVTFSGSLDYTLVQSPAGTLPVDNGNLTGLDPLLGPLADNGGPTLTRSLLSGSPALDSADPSISLDADQRGFVREFNGRADMGAYEFGERLFSDRFEQP